MEHNPETWISELLAAGWKKISTTVWESPSGHFFRGPYGAWDNMHKYPELGAYDPISHCVHTADNPCSEEFCLPKK